MTPGGQSDTADRYRRFADTEAAGKSPLYDAFARAVADSDTALAFLHSLPEEKRQPNLLLGAVRLIAGIRRDADDFLAALADRQEEIRAIMLSRSTQTNEPGRCATLLPILAALPQPLALFELGASAGLCLLPDRYGYDYGTTRIAPPKGFEDAPTLGCAVSPVNAIPRSHPSVVWRGGLDLNPLDAADPEQATRLRTLVWPEQTGRADRLDAALTVAARERPTLRKASLLDPLDELFAGAPAGATRVIFHSAVLAYLPDLETRRSVGEAAMAAGDVWIANEGPRVLPWIAEGPPQQAPHGKFLLSVNGRPVAWTDPHGADAAYFVAPQDVLR